MAEVPGSVIDHFLEGAASVFRIAGGLDGAVTACNPALAARLGVAAPAMLGAPVWPYLTEADGARLRDALAVPHEERMERALLNFVAAGDRPFSVAAVLATGPSGFVILGEATVAADERSRYELLDLTNRYAVLLREHARQARHLQRANERLEATLRDLQDGHWLLKKVQDVLTLCSYCGRVRDVGEEWLGVADYLHKYDLLVSHGVCPRCEPRMLQDLGLGEGER